MRASRNRREHQAVLTRRLEPLRVERTDPRSTDADSPGAAAPLPRPGRHAARYDERRWGGPPEVVSRMRLGPAQLSVVAVVVAIGLALTGWWLLRAQPERVVPHDPAPASPLLTPAADAAASPAAVESLVVDVAGKVRRPGIAVLEPGARVIDALQAAGGARPGVDLSSLNLARALVDGEQILVGIPAAAGVGALVASPGAGPAPGALVNLNSADQTVLESLPEVGPVTAQAIIAWREEHGGFTAVDQLLDVDGIGEATLAKIVPWVTV